MLLKPRKVRPIRRLIPADLGVGMTVCLSVACDRSDKTATKLIMISDTLLTMGITSTQALKARALSATWSMMMAGDDVTHAESVINKAHENISTKTTRQLRDVAFSLSRAYQDVRKRFVEEEYLSPFGLDMETFLGKSADFPTANKRQAILDSIETFDLGCEFMISGFSPEDKHHYIFEIVNPGKYVPHTSLGYWSIGSGSINAIGYLARRNQRPTMSFEDSLYNVIAAKKLAEKAAGVGRGTKVYVSEAGIEGVKFLRKDQIRAIIGMWDKEEAHIRPQNLVERVKEIVELSKLDVTLSKHETEQGDRKNERQ